jgi:ketosteroid isomerase-like protein
MLVQTLNDGDPMYHAVVRARVQALFDAVSRGDAAPVLKAFAPCFTHSFLGDSALGGARTSLPKTQAWYDRLFRLLPDISFHVRRIAVSGAPWNTLVLAEWDETNSGADGVRTKNSGVHVVHLKWGRITKLVICPDTVGLKATLDRLANAGISEARAAPIVDEPADAASG